MSVESNFISKLIETSDYNTVDKLQIKPSYFSGKNKRAFKFIVDFKTRYGKVPSLKEFSRRFSNFSIDNSLEEPLSFYCDEVRRKVKHNTMIEAVEEMQGKLNDLETDEAYKILTKTALKIEKEVILGDTKYLNEDIDKRKEEYERRKLSGGITGIPTAMEAYDYNTGGLGETDLVTILGFTNIGKSWTILIMACNLVRAGYKVLFITREMGTSQIMRRVDAIMCPVSYKRFNKGKLTPEEEEKYFNYLDGLKKVADNNLVVELSTGGVSNVSALVDKHSPDVVFIDGGYLMTDDSADKDWSGIIETWRGFKSIALNRKIPTVVTMQLKENKASLSAIALAKYIAQDCDVVIGMEQSEEMYAEREVMFKFLKTRDSERGGKFILHWDFDKMDWTPIYTEKQVSDEDMPKNLQKVC